MSTISPIIIDQQGLLMKNESPVEYASCVSRPSVKLRDARRIRHLLIHKYIPLKYLLVLLKEQRLIMKPVATWEDPYENFFLKERFVMEGQLNGSVYTSVDNLTKGLYGMSWTLQKETDSLWRIYSPDKLSVMITTKVESLVESVSSEDDKWAVWLSKVKYKTESEVEEWLDKCKAVSSLKQFIDKIGESFFVKRDAFLAEKEFRVIVNYSDKNPIMPSFICCPINPSDFLVSYTTDPRLTKYEHAAIRSALIDAGAGAEKIKQSSLYSFKPRKVEMKYDPFDDF